MSANGAVEAEVGGAVAVEGGGQRLGQQDAGCVGILTGISFVSGVDYYRGINEKYTEMVPKRHLIPPNPTILMASVDCDVYAKKLTEKKWDDVSSHLLTGVDRLVRGGADLLVIASNTGHIAVPAIEEMYPTLEILHIADCTAKAIQAQGITTVGLIGTEPTMREAYLKDRLARHGITVIIPPEHELGTIFGFIMNELGFGVFKDETRAYFAEQIKGLQDRGAAGIILGCTEIELLMENYHGADVPMFASAALHIAAAAEITAQSRSIQDFLPST